MKKLTSLILFFIVACSSRDEVETISIDFKKATPLDLSNAKIVRLQEDSVFIDAIIGIYPTPENYIICASEKVLSYDLEGRFVSEISCMGRASNEYAFAFQTWTVADSVFLFDMGAKILTYNVKGDYIATKKIENLNARGLCQFKDGYVVELVQDTIFSFYDSNFDYKHEIENILPPNKSPLGYYMFNYNNKKMLLQKVMESEIYVIDSTFGMKKKYQLDFGNKTLPKDIANDLSKSLEIHNKYVVTLNTVENDTDIVSLFFFGMEKYMNKYNKNKKVSTTYLLPKGNMPYLYGDKLILSQDEKEKVLTIVPL